MCRRHESRRGPCIEPLLGLTQTLFRVKKCGLEVLALFFRVGKPCLEILALLLCDPRPLHSMLQVLPEL